MSLSTPARVEALEVFVELLSEAESPDAPEEFFNRMCEAVCRLTSMRRAVVFLYDETRRDVRAGGHGVDAAELAEVHTTLEQTPVAQRALAEDRVVLIAENIEEELPTAYQRFLPITKLTCTPVAAAGGGSASSWPTARGEDFDVSEEESHALWTLGKLAALAASARIVTRQRERARGLADRIELARDIHERVVQRLFGVSLALSVGQPLEAEERERWGPSWARRWPTCGRAAAARSAPRPRATGLDAAGRARRLARDGGGLPVTVSSAEVDLLPARSSPSPSPSLARGAAQRAQARRADPGRASARPRGRRLRARGGERRRARGATPVAAGVGLRLTAVEALQHGGMLEFGPPAAGRWRVRLVGAAGGAVNGTERLRVLVVDDHDVVHWGFRLLLGEQPWVERCLSRAHRRRRRSQLARATSPHVALVDLFVGEESGRRTAARPARALPEPRVLLISGAGRISPPPRGPRARRASCRRTGRPQDVAKAVRMVGSG